MTAKDYSISSYLKRVSGWWKLIITLYESTFVTEANHFRAKPLSRIKTIK